MNEIKPITIADNEELLRTVSKPVVFPDNELEQDIKTLEQLFSQRDTILALAAIQIGIPKRLIYLKNTNWELITRKINNQETEDDKQYNEQRVLVNPKIISKEGLTDYWETCTSCLDNLGHVKRPYKIVVEYQDISGHIHQETFEGFEATVLSHEIDHLDGILHMDIADEVLVMSREERKEFRKTHGYNIISKTGDYNALIKNTRLTKLTNQ